MQTVLTSIVEVLVAVLGVGVFLLFRRYRQRSARRTSGANPAQRELAAPAAVSTTPVQLPLSASLQAISGALTPLAEEVTHPAQLANMPEFQVAVTAFRRPEVTLEGLTDYVLGGNWPLACAALVVLCERPDRQRARDAVLQHLPNTRPFVILYALRFLAALPQRPPVGSPFLCAQAWWQNNPIIVDSFREFAARCAELGEQPSFGDLLDGKTDAECAAVAGLLQKVQHPFADQLARALRQWLDTRVDASFLRTAGGVWEPTDRDPLLVEPKGWGSALAAAEAAIRSAHPRSVLVCGDSRVGKSAFIRLLAGRFQRRGWTIFAASGADLMADQIYIGQLEGRIRKVVEAVQAQRNVLWYVPDLAYLAASGTHSGQAASILDQILPDISAGRLIIIGETSQAAATRLFRTRSALRSLLEVVALKAMSGEETASLVSEVGGRIAEQTKLSVPASAIAQTLDLAKNFLGSGQEPGAALELLKRAADRSIAAGDTVLSPDGVIATLSQISGLPPIILDTGQRMELARVQAFFSARVMGQDEAVRAVVDRIALLKAGLTDPGRPIGVFLFAGPTGTGKTELAKTLAEFLFGSADRMVRLDMSEFQTVEATAKILGAHRDTVTDSLIERVRKQPFSVVLLDEFEKAHPNCWDLFLQVFDAGRLADAHGQEADFRHCIIILTSNLGATAHRGGGLGFMPDSDPFAAEQVVQAVAQTFRPEFVNRLDKIIVFKPLTRDLMRGILHKELSLIQERRGLKERAWAVEWEPSAIEFLLDKGFSPEMGARPLKRAIDQLLLAPLATTLVEHRFPEGDQFLFVRSNGREIEVEFVDPDAEPRPLVLERDEVEDGLSLASIVLNPTGSDAERTSLSAAWRGANETLAGDAWRTKEERLRLALGDPKLWSSGDRRAVFTGLELAARVAEAARTCERLVGRYKPPTPGGNRASREMAGRLALQLYNLLQGIDDFMNDRPIDALLRVDSALDTGGDGAVNEAWCRRLMGMYRAWAGKRRMKLSELVARHPKGAPILLVTGFGAFRTLQAEAGLHVLEDDQRSGGARRVVARVVTVSGGSEDFTGPDTYAHAEGLLAGASRATPSIVRRYREHPAPLVRDLGAGWRSGRFGEVIAGDFDLIGEINTQRDRGRG